LEIYISYKLQQNDELLCEMYKSSKADKNPTSSAEVAMKYKANMTFNLTLTFGTSSSHGWVKPSKRFVENKHAYSWF